MSLPYLPVAKYENWQWWFIIELTVITVTVTDSLKISIVAKEVKE